ncbi:MAG: helix-turn-helix domain-containing protein [Treponema sp.]
MDYFAVYKEKKNILKVRKAMVKYALEHGMKPAAREFKTTVKTVKKWVKRFREDAENGLINRKQTSKNDDKEEK